MLAQSNPLAFILILLPIFLGYTAAYELGRRKGNKQGIQRAQEAYRTMSAMAGDMEVNEESPGYRGHLRHPNRFTHLKWESEDPYRPCDIDDCILDRR